MAPSNAGKNVRISPDRTPRPTRRQLLRRALRRKCPQCGEGDLFRSFYTLHDGCECCGMDFDQSEGNTWFFMYFTSGGAVGICFLILFFWRPATEDLPWVSALMISSALTLLIGTLPFRKSLGMAMDYLIEPPHDDAQS